MDEFKIDGNKNPEAKAQAAKAQAEKAIGTVIIRIMPDGVGIDMEHVTGKMLLDSLPCYIEAVIEGLLNPEAADDAKALAMFMLLVNRAVKNGFDNLKKGAKA